MTFHTTNTLNRLQKFSLQVLLKYFCILLVVFLVGDLIFLKNAFATGPTIQLTSTSGSVGASTDISGDNFSPSSLVTITQDGTDTATTVTTDGNGSFTGLSYTPTGGPGVVTIAAHDTNSNTAPGISYTITGNLSLTTESNASLNSVTLDSNPVHGTGNLGTVTVIDERQTNVGWTLTATSTDFSNGAHTIAVTNLSITPGTITFNSGSLTGVTSGSQHVFTSTSDTETLMSASHGNGNGSYSINPSLSLTIPVGSYAGNYSATITQTVQ